MKKILFFLPFIICLFWGCTHNNGNIGPIFGSWALNEISEDGHPYPYEEQNHSVFQFQGEIVRVVRLAEPGLSKEMRTGNFSLEGNTLTMKFDKDPTKDDSFMFVTPGWLPFPNDGMPIHFRVESLKGSHLVFSLDSQSHHYVFSCSRTW